MRPGQCWSRHTFEFKPERLRHWFGKDLHRVSLPLHCPTHSIVLIQERYVARYEHTSSSKRCLEGLVLQV